MKTELEEAAERLYPTTIDSFTDTGIDLSEKEKLIFIDGAKWLQEQDKNKYSEEEVENYTEYCITHVLTNEIGYPYLSIKEWLNNLKNK